MKHIGYGLFLFAMIIAYSLSAHAGILTPEDRTVWIQGEISDENYVDTIQKIQELDKSHPDREITLYIASYGGVVRDGFGIIDAMRAAHAPIRTVCMSYCMSMAAIILASGDKREATPNSTIMVHELTVGEIRGKIPAAENDVQEDRRLQGLMDAVLAGATHKSLVEIKALESYDHYLTPDEAVKVGLIDGVTLSHKLTH